MDPVRGHLKVEIGMRIRYAAWAAAAFLAVAAGVQIRLTDRWWLDGAVSVIWIGTVVVASERLAKHESLWLSQTVTGAAALAALSMISRQPGLTILSGAVAAAVILARIARRPKLFSRIVNSGVAAVVLAAAAVLLRFSSRSPLGTWMLPVMVFGMPLANLAYSLGARTLPRTADQGRGADLLAYLEANGYSPSAACQALVWAGAILGSATLVMSRTDPFVSNLLMVVVCIGLVTLSRLRTIRQAGWGPVLVYGYASLILLLFVASLRFHFLDFLFSQTLSGYLGWDYFLLPRAYDCLLHGVNMFDPYPAATECGYGPWATPFVLHPLSAVVPGAALHALAPWTSYAAFVAGSIGSLFVLYWLFAGLTDKPLNRSAIFLALVASWPLYLMLWLGQTHVFTVLAYGLVLYGLLRRARGWAGRHDWMLIAGLLISLFTKPLVLLFVPPLLVASLTRRSAVIALGIYGVVSALFTLLPTLNPSGFPLDGLLSGRLELRGLLRSGNLYHWGNIVSVSGGLNTNHRDIHVLSTLLNVVLPERIVIAVNQLLLALVLLWVTWLAALPATVSEAARRLALIGCLLISLYYLAYTFAFEHQYPTLALAPIVFLLLLPGTADRALRRYMILGMAAYFPLLLPTIYRLVVQYPVRDIFYDYSAETLAQMTIYRSFRIVPVLLMFIFNVLALRRLRLIGRAQMKLSPEGTSDRLDAPAVVGQGMG